MKTETGGSEFEGFIPEQVGDYQKGQVGCGEIVSGPEDARANVEPLPPVDMTLPDASQTTSPGPVVRKDEDLWGWGEIFLVVVFLIVVVKLLSGQD